MCQTQPNCGWFAAAHSTLSRVIFFFHKGDESCSLPYTHRSLQSRCDWRLASTRRGGEGWWNDMTLDGGWGVWHFLSLSKTNNSDVTYNWVILIFWVLKGHKFVKWQMNKRESVQTTAWIYMNLKAGNTVICRRVLVKTELNLLFFWRFMLHDFNNVSIRHDFLTSTFFLNYI